jgi:tRNA-(ms[2]io[6]A)-hydroxylase
MLRLAAPTDRTWTARALAGLDEVLLDHAHCEKKAASTALALCFRYPDRPGLPEALSPLAREELAHFEQMLGVLAARGVPFGRQIPSPYAGALMRAIGPDEPGRLCDTLLAMALIEARSCERMGLLADALAADGRRAPDGAALAAVYRGLLAAEARHHQAYVDLAVRLCGAGLVEARLPAIAAHEAGVLAASPPMPRLHA